MNLARSAKDVKEWLIGESSRPPIIVLPSRGRGLLTGALNRYLNGDENRYLVLGWLFNDGDNNVPMSSKNLSDAQWSALWLWADPYKEEREWAYKPEFPLEAALVLTAAIQNANERMLKLPQDQQHKLGELETAVTQLGGVITATLTDDGAPDVNEGIEVRALVDEPDYQPLSFLDKIRGKGYYLPRSKYE